MAWVYLMVAGLLEVVWATALKSTDGFTRFWPSVLALSTALASFVLLAMALRSLPVGTGYAIWVGIGAVGTVAFGILVYGEPATPARLFFLALILVGIAGLKLSEG